MRYHTGQSWKIRSIICLWLIAIAFICRSAYADHAKWAAQWGPKTLQEFEAYAAVLADNYEKAAPLLKPMAEKGNPLAQGTLGQFYLKGLGVKKDFAQAIRWLEKASVQGNSESSYTLASMYESGVGVTKDETRAARMLQRAAEQGDKKAPTILAVKYFRGLGVPKDDILAHAWSNIGAALGDEQAKTFRDEVERAMSANKVQEAQRIAREWFARHRNKDD